MTLRSRLNTAEGSAETRAGGSSGGAAAAACVPTEVQLLPRLLSHRWSGPLRQHHGARAAQGP